MSVVWVIGLIVVLLLGWVLTVVGMPGNWLIVVAVIVYAALAPLQGRPAIGWGTVIALAVLALLGELIEFAAAALGVAKTGGSKRGAALAVVGSLLGGVAGLFVGVPVPVIGSLVAALLLAAAGAFGGAVLGEHWKGRDLDESIQVGKGAFVGRLIGTLAKSLVGAAMIAVTVVALAV